MASSLQSVVTVLNRRRKRDEGRLFWFNRFLTVLYQQHSSFIVEWHEMTKFKFEKKKAVVLLYFKSLSRLSREWRKTIAYKSNEDGRYLSWNTKPVLSEYKTTCFIHYVVCLTTGPYSLPKGVIYWVLSSASAFDFQYSLFSLRLSCSCLRVLPRLHVTSLLSPYPSFNNVF